MSNYIVIASAEHLVSVKERLKDADNVVVLSEADLLQYQDALRSRPPDVLLMHSAFATTSRGATLIAAIKATSSNEGCAIRVLIEDGLTPLLLSEPSSSPHDALLETSRPLDRAGTRQAARYPMDGRPVAVNGDTGQLIDLSVSGAQVQSSVRLRPLKVARLVLPEGDGDLRLQGTVAWAIAVPAGGAIQYRAGVQFVRPNQKKLIAFCERYGAAPDPMR